MEFDGHVVEYELRDDQEIVVDTGHLAAMTASCQMEIKSVPGVKNMLFGGEGIFNTVIHGPGKVWLQTMPISTWQEHCVHICHHPENRKDSIITMRTRSIHKAALTDAVTPLEEAGKSLHMRLRWRESYCWRMTDACKSENKSRKACVIWSRCQNDDQRGNRFGRGQ